MKPPIAVFDLDGTLVHTSADLVGSINHALTVHGRAPADYADLANYAGTGGRGMLKRYEYLRCVQLNEPEIREIIATFLLHYDENLPGQSMAYEGAIEFVETLRAAGFKTAVCTNKPQVLAEKLLTKMNLAKQFDAICGADCFAFKKPDPRHLIETIALANGNPARAIMFGDSQTDFDTANAAGIPVVGVTFGYSPDPIHNFNLTKIISDYSEIDLAEVEELTKG